MVRVQHRHIAATRNAGARAARGQLLVFVDADTLITGRVMRRAVEAVRAGAVGGGATVRFDGQLPLYFRALLAATVAFSRVTRLSFGCFLFCTRSAFDAAGGFDEQLYAGEEIALSRALKRQGRFLILRDPVTTSGRKLRTHSTGEVLRAIGWVSLHLIRPRRDRRGLEAWYGERRHDR